MALGVQLYASAGLQINLLRLLSAWPANCALVAEKESLRKSRTLLLNSIREVCQARQIPFGKAEEIILVNQHLAAQALEYLLANNGAAEGFWQRFYFSLYPDLEADLADVCREFHVPCFMAAGKVPKNAVLLQEKLEQISRKGLIWLFECGAGKSLFREPTIESFQIKLDNLSARVIDLVQVLDSLGFAKEMQKTLVVNAVLSNQIKTYKVRKLALAVQAIMALGLPEKKQTALREQFLLTLSG
jgi:hypothetical protein